MILLDLPDPHAGRRRWLTSEPFPFIVVPDVIYLDEAAAICAEFPPPDNPGWHTFTGPLEHGKQEGSADIAGPRTAELHQALAANEFVDWLRVVSGVPDLVADPTRHGGGIHQSGPGARLGMHVDFNVHPQRPDLIRAVNLILFVGVRGDLFRYEVDGNDVRNVCRWRREWGGILHLGAGRPYVEIDPLPGLLVVFEASDLSYHGHPMPMTADAPLRRSVPAYFYRPIRPDETVEAHSTRFLEET